MEGERVLLAVSGGVDSMVMAAKALAGGISFQVAHCNFCLRGAESDSDEELVRSWCLSHGIVFNVKRFDTKAYAKSKGISIEMAARELRYRWFASLADCVMVAHNANDNAETLLLNLVRGTGVKGICGMAAESFMIIDGKKLKVVRPLLDTSREEIVRYARENGVPFREDSTNSDVKYRRNGIRHKVLPVLQKMNPSLLNTFSSNMARFKEVSDIADAYFEEALKALGVDGVTERGFIVSCDKLLSFKHWKYLVYRLMEPYGFNSAEVEVVVGLLGDKTVSSGGKKLIGSSHVLYFSKGNLEVSEKVEPWKAVKVSGPGEYRCGKLFVIISEDVFPEDLYGGDLLLDADKLAFPLELRPWKEGDWMRPLGMGGRRRKLSDIFVSLGMPAANRASAVLLSYPGQEGRVAGIIGKGKPDDSLKVEPGKTTRVIRIAVK